MNPARAPRRTADNVFALLRQLNRGTNMAFLIVTHDPRIAEQTNRIIEIVDGRIVSDAPP